MKDILQNSVEEVVRAAQTLLREESKVFIRTLSDWIAQCMIQKKKLLIAGNGGSLCDAIHFAEELTGQFRAKRPALAAIALADPGHMSCVSNDMGYEEVFARGVEALGQAEDLFIVLTTSGNSSNLIRAVERARERSLKTVGFLGKTGGVLKGMCDLEWIVSGFHTSDRIQEAHMAAIHVILELVEHRLFGEQTSCYPLCFAH
jgi:D-sedoheptulose 7-phosphate isomerase